jgi:hypothetical protein
MNVMLHYFRPVLLALLLPPTVGAMILNGHNNTSHALSPVPASPMFVSIPPTTTPTPTVTPTPKPTAIPTKTPTPTPHLTSPPISALDFDHWFDQYSSEYGVDRRKLWLIAACESELHTNAQNHNYAGLYQFTPSSWQSIRKQMGRDTNPDIRFNAEESIRTAAYKISISGFSSWPACSNKLE